MPKRVVGLAMLAGLVFAATASGAIVVNRGMFGVRLGQTMHQVRHKLGVPNARDFEPDVGWTIWYYERRDLVLDFTGRHGRLVGLYTANPSQRTASGIGVGSSKADVKRLIPGVKCSHTLDGVTCSADSQHGNVERSTVFGIERGRVSDVFIEMLSF